MLMCIYDFQLSSGSLIATVEGWLTWRNDFVVQYTLLYNLHAGGMWHFGATELQRHIHCWPSLWEGRRERDFGEVNNSQHFTRVVTVSSFVLSLSRAYSVAKLIIRKCAMCWMLQAMVSSSSTLLHLLHCLRPTSFGSSNLSLTYLFPRSFRW